MAINVITEDRASGAQVIDGSLKFDGGYLTRTPTSAGNRRTFTWSAWIKRSDLSSRSAVWGAGTTNGSGNPGGSMYFDSTSGTFRVVNGGGTVFSHVTSGNHRDTGWYHIVVAIDTTQSTSSERVTIYINGERATSSGTIASEDFQLDYNNTIIHAIGTRTDDGSLPSSIFNGHMSQVYLIDGLALGPGYFGFTDPLTNTWRPKKFRAEGTTVNDGTVWSNGIPGNAHSSYPATNGFDGSVSTFVYASGTSTMTWTAPKRITGQKIEVYVYAGGNWPILRVNGQNTGAVQGGTTQHNVWVDVTDLCGGPGGVLENIIAQGANIGGVDRQSGFAAVRVDGVIMKDSTTQNLDFGTNGFYLPMDGNSLIGQDKSGNGNDFTPVNFGGSNTIEKATGALPILNTVNGGNGVGLGVRNDANASNLVLALPLVGSKEDVHHLIKGSGSAKSITANGNAGVSSVHSNFYRGSYYFDGTGDSLSVASSSDLGMGTGDFTIEAWVYPTSLASSDYIVCLSGSDSVFGYDSDGTLNIQLPSSGAPALTQKGPVIVANKWNHFAVVRESGALRGYIDGVLAATVDSATTNMGSSGTATIGDHPTLSREITGYLQDVRIYKGTAKYTSNFIPAATFPDILPDTPSGVSGKSELAKSFDDGSVAGGGTTSDYLQVSASGHSDFEFSADFTVEWFMYRPTTGNTYMWTVGDSNNSTGLELYWGSGGVTLKLYTNGGAQNLSGTARIGWSHYAVVRSGSTITVYYNGTSVGTATNSTVFTGNFTFGEYYNSGVTGGLIGPISNFRYVKGTAVYTSNFTPPTEPLTAITNTKLLCFRSNSSATEAVVKPANITSNGTIISKGLNPFNTDIDAVRGQETVYATLDPLFLKSQSSPSLSNGNLTYSQSQGIMLANTAYPKTGKWFFEVEMINTNAGLGIARRQAPTNQYVGYDTNSWTYYSNGNSASGGKYTNYTSHSTITSYGAGYTSGDVIGVALDRDTGELSYYKNGVYQGVAFTGFDDGKEYFPAVGSANLNINVNFGQKPFNFPVPDGFRLLSATNSRPETVISNPETYFKPLIYNAEGGQGGSRHIDVGFEADFIWIKNRNNVKWHILVNGVIGYNKFMSSNSDMALSTEAHVTNVHKTGYTVNDIDSGTVNEPGLTYVAWNWKAGGHSSNYNIDGAGYATASAAGLSCTADLQGASIGTKQGFSIIQYRATSGETVAHGLSQQPDFMMIKNYDTQNDWMVYHKNAGAAGIDLTSSQGLNLNNANGTFTSGSNTFITGKSATTFTVGSSAIVQNSSDDYCAFVWHDVPGLQKFGYYKGNNDSNGRYVDLGFRPALLIIKRTDTDGYYWTLFDSARRTFNVNNHTLNPESNRAEETSGGNGEVDFLSNGFKCRDNDGGINGDGGDYIYMAWAEAPVSNLYGATSNAR